MSRKSPIYSSISVITLFLPLVFLANYLLLLMLGIAVLEENGVDKLFHVLGGLSVSITIAGVLWHMVYRKIVKLEDANLFRALVFGGACLAIISWEIFEYVVQLFPETLTYSDTITDMMSGLIGGLVAVCLIRRPIDQS